MYITAYLYENNQSKNDFYTSNTDKDSVVCMYLQYPDFSVVRHTFLPEIFKDLIVICVKEGD